MIFYANVNPNIPHMLFVGRWTPFHNGHISIIEKKRKENPDIPIMIQIRSTNYDQYSPIVRAEVIKKWMKKNKIKGTIMIIPDIEGIYWGRGVGYKLEEVKVKDTVKKISATKIRDNMKKRNKKWTKYVADKEIANLLSPKISNIIDKGKVIWLTGCPCSGKTTIANALLKKIKKMFPQLKIERLDGDVMRNTPMAENVGFSKKDRAKHIRRMGYLAKMFADHGILVIAAFVSPNKKIREDVKKIIGKKRFVEIYIKASQKERIKRDVKGMYKKAIRGEIKNFTGYNAPYEEPEKPSIICDTDKEKVNQNVEKIINKVFL